MQRLFTYLGASLLCASASFAQSPCFEQSFGTLCPLTGGAAGFGDDVLFDVQPMNITFPMGGNAASYTHASICSNGIIYLTNGPASNGTTYGYQTTAWFVGAAAEDPHVAPLFMDLEAVPANGGGVFFNNTIPGKFVVTYANVVEWATQGPIFTFQAQLFANGDVWFYYGPTTYGAAATGQIVATVGVSQCNGVADPGAVDLTLAGGNANLADHVVYEEFPVGMWDLADTSVQFVNSGTGYIEFATPCTPAYHQQYGNGCYDISNSFYQLLPDASTAPMLNNHSLVFTPAGGEYLVSYGGAAYVAPTSATNLVIGDDGEVSQTPSIPFPTAAGPVSPLFIAANGMISMATNPIAGDYTPDAMSFLNAPVMAFWSWHDFNPTEAGSGLISYMEANVGGNTIAYITWPNVENYPTGVANPSTLQFQLNLSTGAVTIAWLSMDGNNTSPFGSAHLIGWSPAGPSTDGGSINLATALPIVTNSTNVFAMDLTANPAPISSATSGTVVTYTTTNMIQYGGGVYIGLWAASVNQAAGGIPLAILGAPGCLAYVATLDFTAAMVGFTPTNTVNLPLPAGIPGGFTFYSQSVGLVPPNSLPNGQNPGGLIVSNGLTTYISNF